MKIQIIIRRKIPNKNTNDSHRFCYIKINSQLIIEKKNKEIVQGKSYQRKQNKPYKVRSCVSGSLEGPSQIKKEITYYRNRKPNTVCYVFINTQFFFAQPGNKKINTHSQQPDNTEFHHLLYQFHFAK
jgi:hypothetical protein